MFLSENGICEFCNINDKNVIFGCRCFKYCNICVEKNNLNCCLNKKYNIINFN